jgi:hypothetical protein
MERSAGRRERNGTDVIRSAHQTLRGLLQDLGIEWKAFLASMQDEGRHVPSYTFLRQPRVHDCCPTGAALRSCEPKATAAFCANAGWSLRALLVRRNSGAESWWRLRMRRELLTGRGCEEQGDSE